MSPILCDYCDAIAVMFYPRATAAERSFTCAEHASRAVAAVGARPGSGRLDTPLAGRSRFEELGLEAMLARWRAHRSIRSGQPA
jgi:hypothetical protein